MNTLKKIKGLTGKRVWHIFILAAAFAVVLLGAPFKSEAAIYWVYTSANTGGTITPNISFVSVPPGGSRTFTVTPNTGYYISSVSGCGGVPIANSTVAVTYTTGSITASCTVTAAFSPYTYSVNTSVNTLPTVTPAGGTISPTSAAKVPYGYTVLFTVTPNTGYSITTVSGCGGSLSGNTYTAGPITAACTVTATFTKNSYTVTPSAGTGGTISPSTPQTVYYGGTQIFTVTPNTGYSITSVSGCGVTLSSGNTYTTGAITANCNVNAVFNCAPPITYSTQTLTQATVGQAYTYPLSSSYFYEITSGSLPPGLFLGPSGISGTPATAGTYYFTISVKIGSGNCPSFIIPSTITVNSAACSALSITSPTTLSTGIAGSAYSYFLTASGGQSPYTYSLVSGTLPTGINLSSTGAISGTPTTVGTYNFTVKLADSCGTGVQNTQKSFSITINSAACSALNITSPSTLSTGTAGSAYSYQLTATGGQTPYTYSLVSGALPTGTTLTSTGLITGTPTTAGTYSFTVNLADSCGGGVQNTQKTLSITVNQTACSALSITSPSTLSAATVGQAYSTQIAATGGQVPVSFSLGDGSLPAGLTLSSSGVITGIPATAGRYIFGIKAADSCTAGTQTFQRAFTLSINQAGQAVQTNSITVTATPGSFRIARATASIENISYSFTANTTGDITLQSGKGVFMAGNEMLGEISTPINVTVRNGRAFITEAVKIPVSVTLKAEELKTNRITYARTFANANLSVTVQAEGTITTEAGADFKIKRLQLYFENKRPDITVKRSQPKLKAYLDINFTGSGLLQGYWVVDGRMLSTVNTHLVYGRSVTLETAEIPALPTFDTGSHIVRFVITGPSGVTSPEAVYYVTAEDYAEKKPTIKLIAPEDKAAINYAPVTFSWEAQAADLKYVVEFYESGKEQRIFHAYTKKLDYTLPKAGLKKAFKPGREYLWRVRGFDKDNKVSDESAMHRFSFGGE